METGIHFAEPPLEMTAAVLDHGASTLRLLRVPTPIPGTGEALLRVAGCGVCHTDLHVIRGEVAFPRPALLGHEISGTIIALGDGTAVPPGLGLGSAVVAGFIMPCGSCPQCARGRDELCVEFFAQNRLRGTLYDGRSRLTMPDGSFLAMYSMGGLAEYCVVPLTAVAPAPTGVDLAAASILGCAGLTSYGAVFRAAQVEPGATVAVVGSGGIGGAVIRMAVAAGASRIVAVDIATDKLDRAARLGATDLVDATTADPVEQVRGLTGGVDVAFEALGRPETFRQASRMLADGGRMVAIGIAAGDAAAAVEITPLVRRGHTIVGSFGGRTRTDLPEVVGLAERGEFDPESMVTRRVPLADAPGIYEALGRGEIVGRAIVEPRAG